MVTKFKIFENVNNPTKIYLAGGWSGNFYKGDK